MFCEQIKVFGYKFKLLIKTLDFVLRTGTSVFGLQSSN